jgi:RHS repeat-associated protein
MRISRESRRVRLLTSSITAIVLGLTIVGFVSVSAQATPLPAPTAVGMTGSRPSATQLTFPISDQITAQVDVGTGNLEVAETALSLPGVLASVPVGAVFNSMSQIMGSTSVPTANKWTASANNAGTLTENVSTHAIVFVAADGATWSFTPVSGSSTAFTTPIGFQATLVAQVSGSTVTGYTLTYWVSKTVEAFDANGVPLTVTDRSGNVTTFNYTSGLPSSIVSSAGPTAARTAAISYNTSTYTETVAQTSGSLSRNVKYVKDSSSNLVSIQDAMGNSTSFTYTSGNLTKIISVTGAETDFSYDTSGRVTEVDQHNTSTSSPGTSTTRLTYPSSTQTLVAGPDTSASTPVASGPHVTYTIGTGYLVSNATDQLGRVRSATYDTTHNDLPLSTTSGTTGGTTTPGTTTNTYGANSNQSLTSVESPSGATKSATYSGTPASTAYQPATSTDDAGDQTTYTYDGNGNPESSTNTTLAATASIVTNANGTAQTATAPINAAHGSTPANPTSYGYDSNFQLHTITPPTGSGLGVKTLTYDSFGRLSTESDGSGVTTTYTYDKDDRLLTTAFSDGTHTVTNTYNNAGQELTSVSASGTITNTYDQLGNLLTTLNTAGGGTETYTYDAASNLITQVDGLGTITYTYDASNVLTDMEYPHNGSYQHMVFVTDDQGRRTDEFLQSNGTHTVWAAHTQTDYDKSGRISEIIAQTGPATAPVTQFDTSYCYSHGSTAPTCGTAAANDRSKIQWEKDNLSGQVTAFTYDAAGRLLTATQSGGTTNHTYTYTYDADGNRLTAVVTGSTSSSLTLTYNSGNQISTTGYSYDGAGNLTAAPGATYTYNGAEQMTTAVVGGVTSTYTYAGASQSQVLSENKGGSSSVTTDIVYGRTDSQGVPEIEQYSVNTLQAYVFQDPHVGQPLGIVTSNDQACLFVMDGIDNPVALLTNSSTVSFVYSYDPWGVQTLTSGGTGSGASQNPYAFHGGIKDPGSGLIKFGLRWYNPATGTWTQQDTLDAPLDPANANRYAYAGDDPINNIDASGDVSAADAITDCLEKGAIGAIVGLVGSPETAGLSSLVGGLVGCGVALAEDYYESTDPSIARAIHDGEDLDYVAEILTLGII